MKNLPADLQQQLQTMFGPRVNFDKMERRIYSHDVGVLPKLIKPIIGDATAAAVVQPKNERELIELVKWANEHWSPGPRPPPAMAASCPSKVACRWTCTACARSWKSTARP